MKPQPSQKNGGRQFDHPLGAPCSGPIFAPAQALKPVPVGHGSVEPRLGFPTRCPTGAVVARGRRQGLGQCPARSTFDRWKGGVQPPERPIFAAARFSRVLVSSFFLVFPLFFSSFLLGKNFCLSSRTGVECESHAPPPPPWPPWPSFVSTRARPAVVEGVGPSAPLSLSRPAPTFRPVRTRFRPPPSGLSPLAGIAPRPPTPCATAPPARPPLRPGGCMGRGGVGPWGRAQSAVCGHPPPWGRRSFFLDRSPH